MTDDVETIDTSETVLEAAKRFARGDYGALPICGPDKRLKGMITDRDIVVKVLAEGKDPASTKVEELAQGDQQTVTIGADDSVEEALQTMAQHQVRRLPVIDGQELVGMVAQADLARHADEKAVGEAVEQISE